MHGCNVFPPVHLPPFPPPRPLTAAPPPSPSLPFLFLFPSSSSSSSSSCCCCSSSSSPCIPPHPSPPPPLTASWSSSSSLSSSSSSSSSSSLSLLSCSHLVCALSSPFDCGLRGTGSRFSIPKPRKRFPLVNSAGPCWRQLLCRPQLGRLQRRVVLLHPQGRHLPHGALHVLPHQQPGERTGRQGVLLLLLLGWLPLFRHHLLPPPSPPPLKDGSSAVLRPPSPRLHCFSLSAPSLLRRRAAT